MYIFVTVGGKDHFCSTCQVGANISGVIFFDPMLLAVKMCRKRNKECHCYDEKE